MFNEHPEIKKAREQELADIQSGKKSFFDGDPNLKGILDFRKRVLVISTDDGWEGLYIDGKLIDQADTLGEGDSTLYLLKKSEDYNFKSSDVSIESLQEADEEKLNNEGEFPKNLTDLAGDYGKY